MNVLSLFDGMSCGQIALQRAGIWVDNYFASEIDKHAIAVTQHNYPNTIQVGDVTTLDFKTLPKIDLLLGGSPCQSISSLGKKEGFAGKSGLFFYYLDALQKLKPKNFLLENVIGNKEVIKEITKLVGVEPMMVNSNLLSAQNRKRYYWTNIKFSLPNDLGILLRDILDTEPSKACILSQSRLNWLSSPSGIQSIKKKYTSIDPIKAQCLTARSDLSWNCNYVTREGLGLTKLTPEEYEKLQTIPVGYTSVVKTSERYKMLGNGWTVDVIAHILRGIK